LIYDKLSIENSLYIRYRTFDIWLVHIVINLSNDFGTIPISEERYLVQQNILRYGNKNPESDAGYRRHTIVLNVDDHPYDFGGIFLSLDVHMTYKQFSRIDLRAGLVQERG
jgi:hypothetical protein